MFIRTARRLYLTPQILWKDHHPEMAKVLMVLTTGNEETEAVAPADILRRAGSDLTIAKISVEPSEKSSLVVKCARNIMIQADTHFTDLPKHPWDLIMVPGGPGCANFNKCEEFIKMLKQQKVEGRWIGAICAAPALVLAKNGILDGEKATAYPKEQDKLPDKTLAYEKVVVSSKIVTSQGPGTAVQYGLKLVELLYGKAKSEEIKESICAI